jgi:hypothetical protein
VRTALWITRFVVATLPTVENGNRNADTVDPSIEYSPKKFRKKSQKMSAQSSKK